MANIKDIAAKAGVSRGTVDRVLHGRGRVSPENEAKVLAAAKELNYQPGEAGMALAAHKKDLTIGFIYVDMELAPFHKQVYQAARAKADELKPLGVEVRFFPIREGEFEDFQQYLQVFCNKTLNEHPQISGWVAMGEAASVLQQSLQAHGCWPVPIVTYNTMDEKVETIANVSCDYRQSGRIACGIAALMTWEASHVLLVSLDTGDLQSSSQRFHGFREEMQRHYPKMKVARQIFSLQQYGLDDGIQEEIETVRSALEENKDIDCVYIANPGNYEICPILRQIVGDRPLRIITNDLVSEEQRQMLRDGTIDATICQEPDRQGRRPLEILYDYLVYHKTPEHNWEKTRLTIETAQSVEAL